MISAKEALETSRHNLLSRWVGGDEPAAERLRRRLVVPAGRQSFFANPDDSFFAIGSCFARHTEERLEQAGARVTSRNIQVRDLGNRSAREGGIFNKYTPLSILQELRWAAGIEDYPEAALLPVGNDKYYDPYLSAKAGNASREELMARRREIGAYFAQAFDADVVILTLGLIEVWHDLETGLTLNEAPQPRILARHPERFGFSRLSLEQCDAALGEIHAILREHGKAGQKIVLTVSPVPLGRTFTDDDVIVANTTSKSTLRVAALRLAEQAEGLDYFPSYEAVTLSDPALAWQNDRLHVSDLVVGQIIQTFLYRYGVTDHEPPALPELAPDMAAPADDDTLRQLARDLDRYKNQAIRLQAQLRDSAGKPDLGTLPRALTRDPSFRKWHDEAADTQALLLRLYREMTKYKKMAIDLKSSASR